MAARPRSDVVTGEWERRVTRFRSGDIIVGLEPNVDVDATLRSVADRIRRELAIADVETFPRADSGWALLSFPQVADAGEKIPALGRTLASLPGVRFAHPNFVGRTHTKPSDSRFAEQWAAATIELEGAWDITTGNANVLIAVIDSGVTMAAGAIDHSDLDSRSYTFGSNFVGGADVNDDHAEGHGTHVLGIVAADTNNGDGVAGVNWGSPLFVSKVVDISDNVDLNDVADAINELSALVIAKGITHVVVNLSFGAFPPAPLLELALKSIDNTSNPANPAYLVCCASGSTAGPPDEIDWPSAYAASQPHIVAVGAVGETDGIDSPLLSNLTGLDPYRNVTLFAPGVSILSTVPKTMGTYDTRNGTSMATPMVAGVASLVWAVNATLKPTQVRELLVRTGVEIGTTFSRKRLNARAAVAGATVSMRLESSPLMFTDVPAGETQAKKAVLIVESVIDLTFDVVAGSEALGAGLTISARSASFAASAGVDKVDGIEVEYTGGAAGDISFGEFQVVCNETGATIMVYLVANTASPTRTAVVLVADRSGSMGWASGIDSMTRMDVLHESAKILVDSLRVGDALGVVGFASDASLVSGMTDIANAATDAAERVTLKVAIDGLAPAGATSIGDGVVLGNTTVAGAAQENHALIVLTDGHQNAEEFIENVMSEIDVPVFAIGMGTAAVIQPEALAALTAPDGYVVLTDALDDSDRYRVAKYFLQVLAGASDASVVIDPHGKLVPGQTITIPFQLTERDHAFEVFAMVANDDAVAAEVRAPDGTRFTPGALPLAMHYARGEHLRCFRAPLPLKVADHSHHVGTWQLVLSMPAGRRERFVADWAQLGSPGALLGHSFSSIVTARSDLRLHCRVDQDTFEPGASVSLAAWLTDRHLPTKWECKVFVDVRWGNTSRVIELQPSSQGIFGGSFVAPHPGVYTCRFRAAGKTLHGHAYTREQTLTAHVWRHVVQDLARLRSREVERRVE